MLPYLVVRVFRGIFEFRSCIYYRTDLAKEHGQLSLFTETENQEMSAKKYANECILSFVEAFNGKEVA